MEKIPSNSASQGKVKTALVKNKNKHEKPGCSSDNNSASTSDVLDNNSLSSKPKSPSSSSRHSPDPCCAICLEKLQNKCFTNSCRHMFCFKCLVDWSKIKPVCPLCKKHFHSIIHNVQTDLQYDTYHIRTQCTESVWNLTQLHHGMSSSIRISTTNSSQPRFRYRTTVTADRVSERAQAQETLQMHLENHRRRFAPHSVRVISTTQTANRVPSLMRSRIYQQNLWVKPLYSHRFRIVSPDFFKKHPACTHRLLPWLNRELIVLLHNIESQIVFVLELIMALITRYEITSQEFFTHIEPHLHQQTSHFIHEFYNFASSPFEMETYDSVAIYEQHSEVIDDDSNSDIIILDDPDKDIDTSSKTKILRAKDVKNRRHRQDKPKNSRVKKLVLKRNKANSWVPALESESLIPGEIIPDEIIPDISNPGPSTSGLTSSINVSPASPFTLISPVRIETSDEDCEIVAVVKPRSERTPEVVDLSSDDENIIDISSNDNNFDANSDTLPNFQSLGGLLSYPESYSLPSPEYNSPLRSEYNSPLSDTGAVIVSPPYMPNEEERCFCPIIRPSAPNSESPIECVFESTKNNPENTVSQYLVPTSGKNLPIDLSQKNGSSTLFKKNTKTDSIRKNESKSYSDISPSSPISTSSLYNISPYSPPTYSPISPCYSYSPPKDEVGSITVSTDFHSNHINNIIKHDSSLLLDHSNSSTTSLSPTFFSPTYSPVSPRYSPASPTYSPLSPEPEMIHNPFINQRGKRSCYISSPSPKDEMSPIISTDLHSNHMKSSIKNDSSLLLNHSNSSNNTNNMSFSIPSLINPDSSLMKTNSSTCAPSLKKISSVNEMFSSIHPSLNCESDITNKTDNFVHQSMCKASLSCVSSTSVKSIPTYSFSNSKSSLSDPPSNNVCHSDTIPNFSYNYPSTANDPSVSNSINILSASRLYPFTAENSSESHFKLGEPLQSTRSDKNMIKKINFSAQTSSPIDLSKVMSPVLVKQKKSQKQSSNDSQRFSSHSSAGSNSNFNLCKNKALKKEVSKAISNHMESKPVNLSRKIYSSSETNEKCPKQYKHNKKSSAISELTSDSYSSGSKVKVQSEAKKTDVPKLQIKKKSFNSLPSDKSVLPSKIVIPESSTLSSSQNVTVISKKPVSSYKFSDSSTDSYSDFEIKTPPKKKLKLRSVVANFSYESSNDKTYYERKKHKSHKNKKKKKSSHKHLTNSDSSS